MKYIKFKKGYYNIFKELTDKQAGELIKGMAAYAFEDKPFASNDDFVKGLFVAAKREIDQYRVDSANGKRGADKLAENKKKRAAMGELGMLIGSVIVASEMANKDKKDGDNKPS